MTSDTPRPVLLIGAGAALLAWFVYAAIRSRVEASRRHADGSPEQLVAERARQVSRFLLFVVPYLIVGGALWADSLDFALEQSENPVLFVGWFPASLLIIAVLAKLFLANRVVVDVYERGELTVPLSREDVMHRLAAFALANAFGRTNNELHFVRHTRGDGRLPEHTYCRLQCVVTPVAGGTRVHAEWWVKHPRTRVALFGEDPELAYERARYFPAEKRALFEGLQRPEPVEMPAAGIDGAAPSPEDALGKSPTRVGAAGAVPRAPGAKRAREASAANNAPAEVPWGWSLDRYTVAGSIVAVGSYLWAVGDHALSRRIPYFMYLCLGLGAVVSHLLFRQGRRVNPNAPQISTSYGDDFDDDDD